MNNKILIAVVVGVLVVFGLITLKTVRKNKMMRYQNVQTQMETEREATESMKEVTDPENEADALEKEIDSLDTNDFGDTQLSNDEIGL